MRLGKKRCSLLQRDFSPVLVLLGALAACKQQRQTNPQMVSPITRPTSLASETQKPSLLTEPTKPTKPAEPTELLHNLPSVVAVSSRVRNDTDLPEHLVDGNLNTAWNSEGGDLRGGWVAFRLPAKAQVTSIQMTVGFTRVDPSGDFFRMNHRVRKVRVLRDGVSLGEFELDPEKRELQTLAITAPGGDFQVLVLDVLPGSKKGWRELCISELAVWGFLPAGVKPVRKEPIVRVGTIEEGLEVTQMKGPFKSPAAFCDDYTKADRAAAEKLAIEEAKERRAARAAGKEKEYDERPGCDLKGPGKVICDASREIVSLEPPFLAGTHISTDDSAYVPIDCHLALQTAKGWFVKSLGRCDESRGEGLEKLMWMKNIGLSSQKRPGAPAVAAVRLTMATQAWERERGRVEVGTHEELFFCGINKWGYPGCTENLTLGVTAARSEKKTTAPDAGTGATNDIQLDYRFISGSQIELRLVAGDLSTATFSYDGPSPNEGLYSLFFP